MHRAAGAHLEVVVPDEIARYATGIVAVGLNEKLVVLLIEAERVWTRSQRVPVLRHLQHI